MSSTEHPEDRLERTWKSISNWLILVAQHAQKAEAGTDSASIKEMDEDIVNFLRAKRDWGRTISYLEAKLEGTAKEVETLQHYVRTQSKLGKKRKREETEASIAPVTGEESGSG